MRGQVAKQAVAIGVSAAAADSPGAVLARNMFVGQPLPRTSSARLQDMMEHRKVVIADCDLAMHPETSFVATTLPLLDIDAAAEWASGLRRDVRGLLHHMVPLRVPASTDCVELVRPPVRVTKVGFI